MRNLLLLLLLLALGCHPAIFSPVEDDSSDVERMKERILELEREARVSEVERERLRKQVAELEARLAESPPATMSQPAPRLDDGVGGVDETADEPIESADLPPPPRVRADAPTTDPPAAAEPLSEEAQELYDRGYTFYHQGLYLDAESAFQRFLSAHPTSDLADNAHYWIGEARFARADFAGALAAFRETVQRFPQGNKVPDALLREADTLVRLGDVEGARAIYDEVVRRYPSSAAAPTAEERRAQLP